MGGLRQETTWGAFQHGHPSACWCWGSRNTQNRPFQFLSLTFLHFPGFNQWILTALLRSRQKARSTHMAPWRGEMCSAGVEAAGLCHTPRSSACRDTGLLTPLHIHTCVPMPELRKVSPYLFPTNCVYSHELKWCNISHYAELLCRITDFAWFDYYLCCGCSE